MSCFDEILDFYNDPNRSGLSTEIWWNNYLVKLMNSLSRDHNLHILNCILLLLNLFSNDLPDHYHTKGKSFIDLKKEERENLIQLLESEFLD